MLEHETPYRTPRSDTDTLVIPSGDEHELLLLLAIQDTKAAQARAQEEAAIDEETISTQAEEALVMG